MRATLMFHNCEGQRHKTVSTDHRLWSERRAKSDSNRGPSAYQPNALPLDQTGSRYQGRTHWMFIRARFDAMLLSKIVPTARMEVCAELRAIGSGEFRVVNKGSDWAQRQWLSAVSHWVSHGVKCLTRVSFYWIVSQILPRALRPMGWFR